jgi:hypothetical protein
MNCLRIMVWTHDTPVRARPVRRDERKRGEDETMMAALYRPAVVLARS